MHRLVIPCLIMVFDKKGRTDIKLQVHCRLEQSEKDEANKHHQNDVKTEKMHLEREKFAQGNKENVEKYETVRYLSEFSRVDTAKYHAKDRHHYQ